MMTRKSQKACVVLAIAAFPMAFGASFAAEDVSLPYLTWDSGSMPIVYYVNAEAASTWPEGAGAIVRSLMSWERIPGAHVRFQYAGTTEKNAAGDDGENIVTWVTGGWPYGSDTVAFALLWVSRDGQRIVGVDILLNAEDFTWTTDGEPGAMDVQDVLTHEGGHVLGLEHSVTSTEVTMFPVIVPGETRKRVLSDEEEWIIRSIYPSGRTRVDTYALSEGDSGLDAERAMIGYPPVQGGGRIFLLTRVDRDGNGLDEIGTIQEEDGELSFYLFSALTSIAPPLEPLAYNAWTIPEGGSLADLTALDIDGDGEEIGVLRAESDGTYVLYIYDSPVPGSLTEEDASPLVRRQILGVEPGDNLVAVVGMDYDGDGIDEVGAVRLTPQGRYFFDLHYAGQSSAESQQPFLSIPLPRNLGFVDLDVCDIDGDGGWELIALSKDSRGWYVSAYQLPDMSASPERQEVTLLATTSIRLSPGQRPMRLSSLRIAAPDGSSRPAICILMGERM